MKTKVFGIGFHKTATTSLARALKVLGYSVTGPNFVRMANLESEVQARARAVAGRFDAVQDNPWPLLYRELDKWYPGSKFILTVRAPEKWLASALTHFGANTTPMREWIYGAGRGGPRGNETVYLDRFTRHNRDVLEYFRERPDDLLVMNITEGDGWDKLCPFLGVAGRSRPFPRENTAKRRKPVEG